MGLYGTLNWSTAGAYDYSLDNANTAAQRLGVGETLTEVFTYAVDDGMSTSPASLTITIHGVNDAPAGTDDAVATLANSVLSVPVDGFNDALIADSPIAYWRFGEIAGTVAANELSPATPDGTYFGSVDLEAGSLVATSDNSSARFDGSEHVGVPDDSSINTYAGEASQKSFELLFQADEVDSRQVLYKQGGTTSGFSLYLESGELYFGAWDSNVFGPAVKTPVSSDTAYHVVAVFDTSVSPQMTLFVNGQQVASGVTTFNGAGGVSSHTGDVVVGARQNGSRFHDGASSGSGDFFHGTIDELALYNTALNPTQVGEHYDALGLLANDTDSDASDSLSVTAVNGLSANVDVPIELPSGALLRVAADGRYDYNPNGHFDYLPLGASTTDSFTYTIADKVGEESTATVTVTINGTNESPAGVVLTGNNVPAAAALNDVIGELTTSDVDQADTHSYSGVNAFIGSTPVANPFGLSGSNLIVADPGNLVADTTYLVQLTSTDLNGLSTDQVFAVHVGALADIDAPTSSIDPLPAQAIDLVIPLTISGIDPTGGNAAAPSGIKEYRVFVSEDAISYDLYATVPASQPTVDFVAQSNQIYFFQSIAVDHAGNVESKTLADASISVGDFDAPETNVVSATANSAGLFSLSATGMDTGGGDLLLFDFYVSIDGGLSEFVGSAGSGAPNGAGLHSASTVYQGKTDGLQHTYRFFSIGRDSAGNIEAAPSRSNDQVISATFANLGLQAAGIDVQLGAKQRSYIRYLDVLFTSDVALSDLLAAGRVVVERFSLNATNVTPGTGAAVNSFNIEQSGNSLQVDFGSTGISGDPNTNVNDGFYRLMADVNGDGDFDDAVDGIFEFHRILGDANGDASVDADDIAAIIFQDGLLGSNLDGDVNGDGIVDVADRFHALVQQGTVLDQALVQLLDD